MYCSKCGNKNISGANFCIKCGNNIQVKFDEEFYEEDYDKVEISNYFDKNNNISISSNKDWGGIDDALCLLEKRFNVWHCVSVKNNKVIKDPLYSDGDVYSSLGIKCEKISNGAKNYISALIYNEIDFINLWHAFKDCGINWDDISQEKTQEILIYSTNNHYKNKLSKYTKINIGGIYLLPKPRLIVMVCKLGTYEKYKNLILPKDKKARILINEIDPLFIWVPDEMNDYLKIKNEII